MVSTGRSMLLSGLPADPAPWFARRSVLSHGSPLDTKERVRDAIDIVDLVTRYCGELRRSGRNFAAKCPWHDDTRPSLQVNPERQSWKCWVCDIGGDIFSFVMRIEGVDFKEALAMLADQAGIPLQTYTSRHSSGRGGDAHAAFDSGDDPSRRPQDQKKVLFRAMAWIEGLYHDCLLNSPEAEPARRYLEDRGITAESVRKFRLGFSPMEHGWLLHRVGRNPSRLQVLEAIDVLARSQHGDDYYDRFRGRVLFPIHDMQERPVGLGGRVLPELGGNMKAKYLNSRETALFSKSRLLYGLDLARDTIRQRKTALVMEGYTDVIVAHQYGFTNAVAVLGVALNEQHVRMFQALGSRVVLVLDGDEAGRRRAGELLGLFLSKNVDARTLILPAGADPCDFLQQHGAEAFQRLIDENTLDVFEHLYQLHTEGVDIDNDVAAAARALENMLAEIAKAPSSLETSSEWRLRENMLLQRIATRFRMDESELRNRLITLRRAERRRPVREPMRDAAPKMSLEDAQAEAGMAADEEMSPPEMDAPLDACEREMARMLLRAPETLEGLRSAIGLATLKNSFARWLFNTCIQMADRGEVVAFQRIMSATDSEHFKTLVAGLDQEMEMQAEDATIEPNEWLNQVIAGFQHRDMAQRRAVDPNLLRDAELDEKDKVSLLQELVNKQRARHGISDPTEG